MEVRSDRSYRFVTPPEVVWDALCRVDDYRRWWPWLRRLDAQGMVEGDRWRCLILPPVPYILRLTVHLLSVEEHQRVEAQVSGDITGDATLTLDPTDEGCVVRLTSVLRPHRGPLRTVTRVAPWIAHRGHDWVLDTGLRQFRHRAL